MFKVTNIRAARKLGVAVGAVVLASQAHAEGLDFGSITSGVDVSTVATAIIAMGALQILPNVAKWGAKKLASFFG